MSKALLLVVNHIVGFDETTRIAFIITAFLSVALTTYLVSLIDSLEVHHAYHTSKMNITEEFWKGWTPDEDISLGVYAERQYVNRILKTYANTW